MLTHWQRGNPKVYKQEIHNRGNLTWQITLIHDQGHFPAFPTNPDHPCSLILHITLVTQPLISDAMGATLSPLRLRESLKNVGVEFRLEGVESEEVSKLSLEETEVSEQLSEGVSGKG